MASRDDYRAVAERLGERIAALAPEILPNGARQGQRWWRVGSVAGEPGQSLAVELTGAKQGRWFDYAAGEGGDALDLIAAVRWHGDKREAFAWACQWLRLPERQPSRQAPRGVALKPNAAPNPASWVRRIWFEARPLERGDPVDRYLEGRGIALAELGRAPRALRYHPALWNTQTQRAWPAMVAAINSPDGGLVAVHRTWLECDPFGVAKAPIADRRGPRGGAKRTLGGYAGGAIRLWRGASAKPWRDMPADEVLAIGEGIEDTLSAVLNRPAWRAVCAVALSSMLVLELPPQVKTLVILGQNDRPDSDADKLLRRVVTRFVEDGRSVGRRVRFAKPPAIAKIKDWNDLAMWCRKTGTEIAWADW